MRTFAEAILTPVILFVGGMILAAVVLSGCASPFHFNDPTLQTISCAVTAAVLPELEALAVSTGIPLDIVEAMYADACNVAALQGMSQADAEKYGLEKAKVGAARLKAFGAHFDDAGAP